MIRPPQTGAEWDAYYDLRWRALRAPWGQPRGSERDALEEEAFHLMLADLGGRPLAIGRLHLNAPDEAQIRYMAVEESERGKGFGSQLVAALEREAARRGCARVVLNARERVAPFYARLGYRATAAGPTLFGSVRHVAMEKVLAAEPASGGAK